MGGLGEDFHNIFEAFAEDLGGQTMIRATKGKSSRPNHMPSHLDALQTTTCVAFRRLPGELHSVAQQASFNIASGRNFKRFLERLWEVFGGPNGRQTWFLGGSSAMLFSIAFWHRFCMDF